jgi:hypothetical protein
MICFSLPAVADTFGQSAAGYKQGESGAAVSGGSGPSGNTANVEPTGKAPTLEKCGKPLGTLAVSEPQDYVMQALQQAGLPKPNGLIRIMVQQSNCFMVVERGVAMQNIQQERALADGGQLRKGSNMGKGQLATADYVMTPEVVFKNNDAGGIGGAVGGLLGHVGAAIGGSLKFKEAQTTLTVADTRSGIQVASASGSSQKTDWGLGGLLGGGGAGLGLGAYENTAEGKVVAMAFLDAYNTVVNAVRGSGEMQRTNATLKEEAGKVVKAGEVAGGGDVFAPKINGIQLTDKPNAKGKVLAKLKKDEEVVATGQEDGEYIKVQTGSGKEGWVKKAMMKKGGS